MPRGTNLKEAMGQLAELAERYGTDKGRSGPSKRWGGHNYVDVYEGYFFALRDDGIRLLEIGLGVSGSNHAARIATGTNTDGGASLHMWRDYFAEADHFFGIDINPAEHLADHRTTIYQGDQGDRDAMERIAAAIDEGVDIVIDDGSHNPMHQQISLETFLPIVKPGGLYIVEDLLSNGLGGNPKAHQYCPEVLSTRDVLGAFADDCLPDGPHDFENPEVVRSQVDSINFHCPVRLRGLDALKRTSLRDGYGREHFKPGTERLAVLRKR
jgi:hypothetical protein